jgi:calnexin
LFAYHVTSEIPTVPDGGYVHFQDFGNDDWTQHWTITPLSNYTGKWEVEETKAPQAIEGEKMLFMKTAMSYYGISTKFDQPMSLQEKTLVVQYEVRLQETLECGGAYIKLFGNDNFEPTTLCNETRYVIMFGPDKCGNTNKVHFIFRYKSPKTGEWEEKHMKDAPEIKTDKVSHLYTLVVRPDNTFEVLIDDESVKEGSLLNDFAPPVNPPKEIDDPTDIKPADWVDEKMMADPTAKKPDDWDETAPEYIPDPEKLEAPEGWLADEPKFVPDENAKKPDDWDDDIHGEWEAPTIPNPKCESAPGCGEYEAPLIKNPDYKGKWEAPQIENPAYKGEWKPRQIPNPDYFEDLHPHNFPDIVGAGFELWMVNKDIGFNNVYIGNDEAAVHAWNQANFVPKHKQQAEEQAKIEPKEEAAEHSFAGSFNQFFTTIKDAYISLYNDNKVGTIVISSLVVMVPMILIIVGCCKSSPKPQNVQAPKVQTKKAETTEEPKKTEEAETTEEQKTADEEPESAETPATEEPTEVKKRSAKSHKSNYN